MTTLIGLVAGLACMVIGIILAGNIGDFMDGTSVFIVVGGTVCAIIMAYPMKDIMAMLKAVGMTFKYKEPDPTESIQQIIDLANVARKEGLLALENMLEDIKSPFLRKGIMLIVDGSNSELVKSVMETDIFYIGDRHDRICSILSQGAAFSPSFGMAGTLIGLIAMLVKLDDPSTLGPSMAVAMITTFYGVLLANLFFTPMSKKLKAMSDMEAMQHEMMLEGILSIQDGENPRMIRDKLEAFISSKQIAALDQRMNAGKEVSSDE